MRPLLAAAALLLAGCPGDECAEDDSSCAGGVAQNCVRVSDSELTSHRALHREACGERLCEIVPLPGGGEPWAQCVVRTGRDPSCPPDLEDRVGATGCEGQRLVRWDRCHRVEEAACPGETTCTALATCPGDAACKVERVPESLCATGRASTCLDASEIVHCRCGFAIDAHPCANPGPSCVMIEAAPGVPVGACR